MDITIKYDRESFFGGAKIYTEESVKYASFRMVKKAFCFLGKHNDCSVVITEDDVDTMYFWNNMKDFENGVVTLRKYEKWNSYEDTKSSFAKAKSEVYKAMKGDKLEEEEEGE